jgi:hypothetical protein
VIHEWADARGVVISADAVAALKTEADAAVELVEQDARLREKLSDDAFRGALIQYLDQNLTREKGPGFDTLLVASIAPGGIGLTFPTRYPVLEIVATFELTGVTINGEEQVFEPTKSKKLLLRTGESEIATRGGGDQDCRIEIRAKKGQHYRRHCPE